MWDARTVIRSALAADAAGPERSRVRTYFLERSHEGLDVCIGKVLGEVSFDSVPVVSAGAFERFRTRVGENDEDRASVSLGPDAPDESRLFHPVDDSSEAALAEEDPVGQLVHRHAVRRFLEVDEDVIPALRDAGIPLELRIEDVEEREGAFEEEPPGMQPLGRRA